MSRNSQPSFCVKASHRFVNPQAEDFKDSYPSEKQKAFVNTENTRKEGSEKGIAIKTTNTSIEDFM